MQLARILVAWVCAIPIAAHAGARSWDRPMPTIRAKKVLREVLRDTRVAANKGEKPIGLFDLDDTVIKALARLGEAARRAGLPTRGLVSAADLYAGLPPAQVAERRAAFGKGYFEDSSLLALDQRQKGVRRFLLAFMRAGGRPLFGTGRWESTRKATEAQLEELRIPLRSSRDLLLNPGPPLKAREWKLKVPKLAQKRGRVMIAVDNEAVAANNYRRAFPRARIVRLKTFRFDEAPAKKPADVAVMRDFSF